MPRLRQSLFWLYIHSEAKLSTLTLKPTSLWKLPSLEEKKKILILDWYDFHQIYTITFIVDSLKPSERQLPLILSFFFLTPRWFLVPEFDSSINSSWETSINSSKPSIITSIEGSTTPASWFLLKQNDPDLLRLIIVSINENQIFIPPYSNFIFTPLGITPPIVSPKNASKLPPNFDPNSDKHTKGGHKVFYSEAMPQQWIFNPPRDYFNPE